MGFRPTYALMEIPAWLGTLTPVGALMAIVMLIAIGKLLPERTHNKIMDAKDEALRVQAETTQRLLEQSDQSLENDATMLHLLRSLPTAKDAEGGGSP